MNCYHCGSSYLRLSRLRAFDVRQLLQLQVPVRCRSCMERRYVSLFFAWNKGLTGKTLRKQPQQQKKIDQGKSAA
jgi:hypothetical protein